MYMGPLRDGHGCSNGQGQSRKCLRGSELWEGGKGCKFWHQAAAELSFWHGAGHSVTLMSSLSDPREGLRSAQHPADAAYWCTRPPNPDFPGPLSLIPISVEGS